MTQENPIQEETQPGQPQEQVQEAPQQPVEVPVAPEPPVTLSQQLQSAVGNLTNAARALDASKADRETAAADLQSAQAMDTASAEDLRGARDGFVEAANAVIGVVTALRDSA